MRKLISIAAFSLLAASAAASASPPREANEAKLARTLEGRVAGKPVNCINLRNVRSSRIIDRTAILYDAGSTIYVNRPRGAETLDRWDTLVTRLHSSQLCSIDTVNLYDSALRFQTGFVFLSEFVPYKKVR